MNLEGSTVAVTGSTGFIGKHLVEYLNQKGCKVIAIARAPRDFGSNIETVVTGYSKEEIEGLFSGVDAVIHLAGRRMTRDDAPNNLDIFLGPNVLLTGDLLDSAIAEGVKKFVLASTIAVYSPLDAMPYREDGTTHPVNAYALSKKIAEDYLTLKATGSGLNAVILRLGAVYGCGEKNTPALMKFVDLARRGETLRLTGNPNHCIDQLYIRDAVSAFVATLEQEEAQGVFNIGCGYRLKVEDIAKKVNSVFGNEGKLDLSNAEPKAAPRTYMDIGRALRHLGWSPGYSLVEGLENFRSILSRRDNAA